MRKRGKRTGTCCRKCCKWKVNRNTWYPSFLQKWNGKVLNSVWLCMSKMLLCWHALFPKSVMFSVCDSPGFFFHSLTGTPKLTLSLRVRHSAAACSSLQMSQLPPLLCIFCTSCWGKRPLCLHSRERRSPLLPHHHRECIRQVHIAIWWSASLILCAKY